MAALAQAPAPDPIGFGPATLAAYNDLIARTWQHAAPFAEERVERELAAAVGQALSGLRVLQVSGVRLDASAPPALAASPPAPQQTLHVSLPGDPGGWSLRMDAIVGGTLPINLAGIRTSVSAQLAVVVEATAIRVQQPLDFDLADPVSPSIAGAGLPQLSFHLALHSQDALFQQLLPQLTQLLRPVVRAALLVGSAYAQQQLGLFVNGGLPPGRQWGRGGPGVAPPTGAPDLEPICEDIHASILADHMPFGNVYPALFDTPGAGGSVVGYSGWGDSALWTGVFLGTSAYRHDLTGRTDGERAMREMVRYYDIQTRVTAPSTGLLARAAMPAASPLSAPMLRSTQSSWVQTVDGVAYVATGNTSRDAYTGTMFGLAQSFHRVPALRPHIVPIVDRMLAYLEGSGWMIYQAPLQANVGPNGPGLVMSFALAPLQVCTFSTIGAVMDPARWLPLKRRVVDMLEFTWFNSWFSSHEVHAGYYGFHLAHVNTLNAVELETDPRLYRGYLKNLRVLREPLAHHQNAAFEAVHGIAVPTEAGRMAPMVRSELEQASGRPRRGFPNTVSQDPTIQTTTYTTNLPNQPGPPGQAPQSGTRSIEVAVYPVPIAKRPNHPYIWSSNPFRLDGAGNPREQHPGMQMLFPYWIARSHGLLGP
jgi:hypothetical protein